MLLDLLQLEAEDSLSYPEWKQLNVLKRLRQEMPTEDSNQYLKEKQWDRHDFLLRKKIDSKVFLLPQEE